MVPELMLDLVRQTAELLVDRIKSLPEESAWDDVCETLEFIERVGREELSK